MNPQPSQNAAQAALQSEPTAPALPPPRYAYAKDAGASTAGDIGNTGESDAKDAGPAPDPYVDEAFRRALPPRLVAPKDPAARYANLSPATCRKELKKRKLPFRRQGNTRGVATALRFDGQLSGVDFITAGGKSPFGVLDCRLALTLSDLGTFLAERGVTRVRVDNFYRPGARLPGSRRRSQHHHGLAMDLTEVSFGELTLNVETDWGSGIEDVPCGPEAQLSTPVGLPLRNLMCEVAAAGFFHHILTPCHDAAHRNHVHLDIKRDAKSSMIR